MSAEQPSKEKGLHHKIWPYMDHLVQYATDRVNGEGPWIVRDRSAALRAERRGEGPAMVRIWVPGPWAYVTPPEQGWGTNLPGWRCIPDPVYEGARLWYHTDRRGVPDIALARTEESEDECVVLESPSFTADDVRGQELQTFSNWDDALRFAEEWLNRKV